MSSLAFLIPVSILLLLVAGIAFFWAVDHGQFDDMETPGLLPVADADSDTPRAAEPHAGTATRGLP